MSQSLFGLASAESVAWPFEPAQGPTSDVPEHRGRIIVRLDPKLYKTPGANALSVDIRDLVDFEKRKPKSTQLTPKQHKIVRMLMAGGLAHIGKAIMDPRSYVVLLRTGDVRVHQWEESPHAAIFPGLWAAESGVFSPGGIMQPGRTQSFRQLASMGVKQKMPVVDDLMIEAALNALGVISEDLEEMSSEDRKHLLCALAGCVPSR